MSASRNLKVRFHGGWVNGYVRYSVFRLAGKYGALMHHGFFFHPDVRRTCVQMYYIIFC